MKTLNLPWTRKPGGKRNTKTSSVWSNKNRVHLPTKRYSSSPRVGSSLQGFRTTSQHGESGRVGDQVVAGEHISWDEFCLNLSSCCFEAFPKILHNITIVWDSLSQKRLGKNKWKHHTVLCCSGSGGPSTCRCFSFHFLSSQQSTPHTPLICLWED